MALTKLTADLNYNQAQPDKPPLTAPQMKILLDSAGNEIKTYINDTLTEELDGNVLGNMNRQAIIDGGFQVAQAVPTVGTVVNNPASGTYPIFDMYAVSYATDGGTHPTISHSQQNLNGVVDNVNKMYKISFNGAGTSLGSNSVYRIRHGIYDGVKLLCGLNKKVTVSFYAKSTITNKKIGIALQQVYGTSGSPSSVEIISGSNFTLTTSWTKYSYTFITNDIQSKTFTQDNFLNLNFYLQWGSNIAAEVGASTAETFIGSGDVEITALNLCSGDISLDYESEQYPDVLRKCQFQFMKVGELSHIRSVLVIGNNIYFDSQNTVPMRIIPTLKFGTIGVDYDILNTSGTVQTGFTLSVVGGTSTDHTLFLASKTSHGLTDAVLKINTNKNFLDSRP